VHSTYGTRGLAIPGRVLRTSTPGLLQKKKSFCGQIAVRFKASEYGVRYKIVWVRVNSFSAQSRKTVHLPGSFSRRVPLRRLPR
jgi:hypothetical protein